MATVKGGTSTAFSGTSTGSVADKPIVDIDRLQLMIKERLASRGAKGIHGIGKEFRIHDDDGNRKLSVAEFSKALAELGIAVNKTELDALVAYYDKDHDGNICFEEFLFGLRSTMSPRRVRLVEKAFELLDRNTDGNVTVEDVMTRFDAKRHPDVISGRKLPQEVLQEFLGSFEGAFGSGNKDSKVTYAEFAQYYSGVSASIDDDAYFAVMMCSAWHITEEAN